MWLPAGLDVPSLRGGTNRTVSDKVVGHDFVLWKHDGGSVTGQTTAFRPFQSTFLFPLVGSLWRISILFSAPVFFFHGEDQKQLFGTSAAAPLPAYMYGVISSCLSLSLGMDVVLRSRRGVAWFTVCKIIMTIREAWVRVDGFPRIGIG